MSVYFLGNFYGYSRGTWEWQGNWGKDSSASAMALRNSGDCDYFISICSDASIADINEPGFRYAAAIFKFEIEGKRSGPGCFGIVEGTDYFVWGGA
jgi:hypothetical protein